MPQPCSSRKLVLTFDRATESVVEISSAGSGFGDRYSSACTCATVRLIPHFVPISPQCKMNFSSTAVSPEFRPSLINSSSHSSVCREPAAQGSALRLSGALHYVTLLLFRSLHVRTKSAAATLHSG